MATIKAYSNLQQSKKLAEILPLESADMCYRAYREEGGILDYFATLCPYQFASWVGVPCWSLAALLSVLPDYTLQTNTDGTVFVVCDSKKPMISDAYNNPIDACYEMIIHLHSIHLL